jgi:hypothetical protein
MEDKMRRLMSVAALLAAAILFVSCSSPGSSSGLGSTDPVPGPVPPPDDHGLVVDPATGVVAGLDFNEDIDEDSPVTIVGAVWTDGISGSGLAFNGYDEYVTVPDSASLTLAGAGTVEAWIYAYAHTNCAGVVHKGEKPDFSDESWSLQFWGTEGQLALFLTNEAGTAQSIMSTANLATGQWYHVAAAWDAAMVRLYINGQENTSAANTIGSVRDSDGRLIIGAQLSVPYDASFGHVGFNGIIDEVSVIDHALSAAEIDADYQALKP